MQEYTREFLLSPQYNRQVFSLPTELPNPPFAHLKGVKFKLNIGRYLSLPDDRPTLTADLTEEYNGEHAAVLHYEKAWRELWTDKRMDGFTEALAERRTKLTAWNAYDKAWTVRLRLRLFEFLYEDVDTPSHLPKVDPTNPDTVLKLEPQAWAERGQTVVLNALTNPVFWEVMAQLDGPFLARYLTQSTITSGTPLEEKS